MTDGPKDKNPSDSGADLEETGADREFFSGKSMSELAAELGDEEEGETLPEGMEKEAEELERIMQPARGRARHPVLAGSIILFSLVLMWMMRKDFIYFFRARNPVQIDDLQLALKEGRLKDNTYVRVRGQPDLNTKATVSRRGCALLPKSAPKNFYNFYVVRNSFDKLVVRRSMSWKERTQQSKRPVIDEAAIGRLRLFRTQKAYFQSFARFLHRMSDRYPTLRNEHTIERAELMRKAGRPKPMLQDRQGRKISITARTPVMLYVEFDNQFEVVLSKTHKEELDQVVFQAGDGAAKCGRDNAERGGNVVLVKDKTVVSLDFLREKKVFRAADGKSTADATALSSSPDLILRVPDQIKVYDASNAVLIPFSDEKLLVARGGACGGQKGATIKVSMEARPFSSVESAEALVSSLGHPLILTEETPESYTFVITAPPSAGRDLVKKQRRGSAYSISSRTEWYRIQWRDLSIHEGAFFLQPARPSHPADYREAKAPKPKKKEDTAEPSRKGRKIRRLIKAEYMNQIKIPVGSVQYAELTSLRNLPADAWVVLDGVKPSQLYYYPLLYLLLFGFMLFNIFAIFNYFRARRSEMVEHST